MPREITGTRDQLVQLNETFPDKEGFTKKDIYSYLQISRNTLRKRFPELWQSQYTSKVDLAKVLARHGMRT